VDWTDEAHQKPCAEKFRPPGFRMRPDVHTCRTRTDRKGCDAWPNQAKLRRYNPPPDSSVVVG
jgi:hypothetical protein